jgi:hypothetical protein
MVSNQIAARNIPIFPSKMYEGMHKDLNLIQDA